MRDRMNPDDLTEGKRIKNRNTGEIRTVCWIENSTIKTIGNGGIHISDVTYILDHWYFVYENNKPTNPDDPYGKHCATGLGPWPTENLSLIYGRWDYLDPTGEAGKHRKTEEDVTT